MLSYIDFPPFECFKRVLLSCPNAAFLYALIWKQKSNENTLAVSKSSISKKFLVSPTLFRNSLLALGKLDLVTFEETLDSFLIAFHEP